MDDQTKKSLEDSKQQLAVKAAEIIARRTARVTTRKFLWLFLLGIPRLARLRALNAKANEFLSGDCCCGCHK